MDVVKPKPSENSLNAFPTLGRQLFSFTLAGSGLCASPFPGRESPLLPQAFLALSTLVIRSQVLPEEETPHI